MNRRIQQAKREAREVGTAHQANSMPTGAAGRIRTHLEKALAELPPNAAAVVPAAVAPWARGSRPPPPMAVAEPFRIAAVREGLSTPKQRILGTLAKLETFGVSASDKGTWPPMRA